MSRYSSNVPSQWIFWYSGRLSCSRILSKMAVPNDFDITVSSKDGVGRRRATPSSGRIGPTGGKAAGSAARPARGRGDGQAGGDGTGGLARGACPGRQAGSMPWFSLAHLLILRRARPLRQTARVPSAGGQGEVAAGLRPGGPG